MPRSSGSRQELFIDGVVGFPSHPMTREDVETKALELLGPRLGASGARRLIDRVRQLETVADVNQLVTAIAT